MHVFDGIHNLDKNSACSPLAKSNLFCHKFEKFTLLSELRNKEDVLIGFDDFVELNNIGVPEYSHDFNLSVDSLLIVFVFDSFFVDNFDGNFFLGGNMDSFLNFTESAPTEGFANLIISDGVFLLGVFLLFAISYFFLLLSHILL